MVSILARQEGRRFGRRMPAVMPLLATLLTSSAATSAEASATAAADADTEGLEDTAERGQSATAAAAAGWQEPYAGLLLLQTLHTEARGN